VNLIRVRRAKHATSGRYPRHSGYRNWIVTDYHDGAQYVFCTFTGAIEEADRLARTGLINPHGMVGCYSPGGSAVTCG
jgi:hypothetical protein